MRDRVLRTYFFKWVSYLFCQDIRTLDSFIRLFEKLFLEYLHKFGSILLKGIKRRGKLYLGPFKFFKKYKLL